MYYDGITVQFDQAENDTNNNFEAFQHGSVYLTGPEDQYFDETAIEVEVFRFEY